MKKEFNPCFKVDDIKDYDGGFIESIPRRIADVIDNMLADFLNEQGYKIEKPYTEEKVVKIKEQLDKENKYVDFIQLFELGEEKIIAHHIPFIENKDKPLSQENREFIIEKYKKLKGIKDVAYLKEDEDANTITIHAYKGEVKDYKKEE